MSNLLFEAINLSVQLFNACLHKLTSSHSTKFLKEHSSVKNWRENDEWKTSLFLTSYNQIIIWSSILYSALGMIVLQAKKKENRKKKLAMLQFKIKFNISLKNRCWVTYIHTYTQKIIKGIFSNGSVKKFPDAG